MKYPIVQHYAGRLNGWLLALLAFALPLSTSALSSLALLILVVWVVEGRFQEKWRQIIANPVVVALLVYFAAFVLGLLWTEDLGNGVNVLKKQWKILLLPVFITAMHCSLRRVCAGFFLVGMTVAMTLTYLAWFGLVHYADITPTHLTRGTSHVIYNPLLAFALYLVGHELLWGECRGWLRRLLIVLAALMTLNMFITEGRSGQLAFFVLAGLFLLQVFRQRLLRATVLVAVLLPLVFTACYQLSPVFHGRVDRAYSEVLQCERKPNTSVGLRLLFWKNSWEIIKEHPILGVGTGDFQQAYAKVNAKRSRKMVATDNPHNQYILVTCQLGLLGLAALAALFATQIRQAMTRRDGWERVRLAFPVFFLVIMLTESYLIINGTGFLFSLFGAVLYGLPGQGESVEDLIRRS